MNIYTTFIPRIALTILTLSVLSCLGQFREFLRRTADYKQLDEKIVHFIDNPTYDGWEDNLLDMGYYVRSLESMVRDLDGGVTLGSFNEAVKLLLQGKPNFMDKVVDDNKYSELRIADEQLERLYYMQKYAKNNWKEFKNMVAFKKTMANILL